MAESASRKGVGLTTAIVGVGNIGGALARRLVAGGESVVLAAKDESRAEALATELGPLARAASVDDAIADADAVVLALWLDTIKELIPQHARLLEDKVVVDPSNPVAFDANGQMMRTLPERQSAGSVVAALLPASAHYVKHLARSTRTRSPEGHTANHGGPCSSTPPTTPPLRRLSSV